MISENFQRPGKIVFDKLVDKSISKRFTRKKSGRGESIIFLNNGQNYKKIQNENKRNLVLDQIKIDI